MAGRGSRNYANRVKSRSYPEAATRKEKDDEENEGTTKKRRKKKKKEQKWSQEKGDE